MEGPTGNKCTIPDNLVGDSNECEITIDGIRTNCLIDSGSQVTTVSQSFKEKYLPTVPIHSLENLLRIEGAASQTVPYLGYVECEISGLVPDVREMFPILVVPDFSYSEKVPVLIGTNVLQVFKDATVQTKGHNFLQKVNIATSVQLAFRAMSLKEKHLEKSKGELAVARNTETSVLEPGETQMLCAKVRVTIPTGDQLVVTSRIKDGPYVAPHLLEVSNDTRYVPVEVRNQSTEKVTIPSGSIVCTLSAVHIEDPEIVASEHSSDEEFLSKFDLNEIDDLNDLCSNKDTDAKTEAKDLLLNWKHIFSQSATDIGHTNVVKHRIELCDPTPVNERSRRVAPALYEEVKRHIQQMLDMGVIRESTSPWNSNIVVARKRDNTLRICIDFRKLNNQTVKFTYQIPKIDDNLEMLGKHRLWSSIDMTSSYWQVEVEEEHKKYTAFSVPGVGKYECHKMPFGLCNAPSTFQSFMEKVLKDVLGKICMVYLDDIIIFSDTFEEHVERLNIVFGLLEKAGIKLKPAKCSLFKRSLKHLGHLVSEDGISVNPEYTSAVADYPVPNNPKEVERYLG